MSRAFDYARFAAALAPDLIALTRALFVESRGDAELARVQIRRIQSRALAMAEERDKTDRKIAEQRAREQKP